MCFGRRIAYCISLRDTKFVFKRVNTINNRINNNDNYTTEFKSDGTHDEKMYGVHHSPVL